MGELALSVVLPLQDHRGLAVASAMAWAGQTLRADRYEIVALDGSRDSDRMRDVRHALRDGDRLLLLPGRDEIELYQAGAAAARGRTLLFTESHCVPETDAALELVSAAGSFRWTTPAALMRLALPRGTYRVRLRLMRPPGDGPLSFRLNGRLLRQEDVCGSGGDVTIATSPVVVSGDGEQQLVVLATALEPRLVGLEDERTLGVAVRRLAFAPC